MVTEIHRGGIEEPTLESIKVKNHASKVEFAVGETFDYTGLTLTAKYSDKTTEEIKEGFTVTLPEANIDSENKVKIAGEGVHNETVDATVTYQEKTTSYKVTIKDNAEVKSIEVSLADSVKKTYAVGDDLDESGISVLAFYSEEEGAEGEDVTEQATITFTVKGENDADVEFTTVKDGEFDVTITATFDEKTATKTVTITVEAEEDPEETTDYVAPDLSSYYKKYFFTTDNTLPNFGLEKTTWDGNATFDDEDESKVTNVASMWGGDAGFALVYKGFDAGTLANYEYLVLTLDTNSFVSSKMVVKIPEVESEVTTKWKKNSDGSKSYFAKISDFSSAANAVEYALLAYGEGSVYIKEIYVAAAEDPSKKAITEITITPTSASLEQNGTQQFTVKDSNLVNITDKVTYTLTGDAATGSTITEAGLLTVGTTAGALTVTATYEAEGYDEPFTAEATITVLKAMTNLVSSVTLNKYVDSAHNTPNELRETGDIVAIDGTTVTLNKVADGAWGEWSCQLFLNVSASEGNIFEAGKKYYVAVTVNSTAALSPCVWKEDTSSTIDQHGITYEAGVPKVLKAEITPTGDMEKFNCLLSFPGDASTITISDITVYDITEE